MTASISRPFAIITGASSGIGLELARQFALHDFDLLIVAENEDILTARDELSALGTDVRALQCDLATFDGNEELYRAISNNGRPIDAVAINAGVGVGGASFVKSDLNEELRLIDLNIKSAVHLAKRVLPEMIRRGHGRLLFTSSIAARMPGPYESVYSASKAFLLSFAEALREEVRSDGVSITVLMPGPTETEFFHRAGMDDTKVGHQEKDDPADVAREGFAAMMDGRDHIVAGSFMTKVETILAGLLPDSIASKLHERLTRPTSPLDQ